MVTSHPELRDVQDDAFQFTLDLAEAAWTKAMQQDWRAARDMLVMSERGRARGFGRSLEIRDTDDLAQLRRENIALKKAGLQVLIDEQVAVNRAKRAERDALEAAERARELN